MVLPQGEAKAAAVRDMFDTIAPRYDMVNRIMTFRLDVRWRRRALRMLALVPDSRVLDLVSQVDPKAGRTRVRERLRRGGRARVGDAGWARLARGGGARRGAAPRPREAACGALLRLEACGGQRWFDPQHGAVPRGQCSPRGRVGLDQLGQVDEFAARVGRAAGGGRGEVLQRAAGAGQLELDRGQARGLAAEAGETELHGEQRAAELVGRAGDQDQPAVRAQPERDDGERQHPAGRHEDHAASLSIGPSTSR